MIKSHSLFSAERWQDQDHADAKSAQDLKAIERSMIRGQLGRSGPLRANNEVGAAPSLRGKSENKFLQLRLFELNDNLAQ